MIDPRNSTALTSPARTSLEEKLHQRKTSAVSNRAAYSANVQRTSPNFYAMTTIRTEPGDDSKRPGAIHQATNEMDEAARKTEARRRALAGEPLGDDLSLEEQNLRLQRQVGADEDAIEYLLGAIDAEKNRLAIEHIAKIKPAHDLLMKKLARPILEFHSVLCEIYDLKQNLIDNEIGLHGLCYPLPIWAGHPRDAYSEFGEWLRQMAKADYLNSNAIPKETR